MSSTKSTTSGRQQRPAPAATDANASEAASIAPADDFEASGAVIEDGAKDAVDMTHPAVDANPRANTTAEQNRIDFNDPVKTGQEIVEEQLKAQSAK